MRHRQKFSNKKFYPPLFIILLIMITPVFIAHSSDYNFFSQVESLNRKNFKRVADLQRELFDMRQKLIRKNNKFKVGMTEVFKFNVKQVTGFDPSSMQKIHFGSYNGPNAAHNFQCNPRSQSWDWRKHGIPGPIKVQGDCGACWAFTAVNLLEASYRLQKHGQIDLSEQFLINCVASGCSGGFSGKALHFAQKNGLPLENSVPFYGKEKSCDLNKSGKYYTASFGWVSPRRYTKTSVWAIKKALCKYGPIASSIHATRTFLAYKSGIFDEQNRQEPNHALMIIGWDNRKKAFLVQNSWGRDWGENGYGWVQYGSNRIGSYAQWAVLKVGSKRNKNSPPPGMVSE